MIAVGVAILTGFQIYDQTHRESAIDTMTKDIVNLASITINYYRTPGSLSRFHTHNQAVSTCLRNQW